MAHAQHVERHLRLYSTTDKHDMLLRDPATHDTVWYFRVAKQRSENGHLFLHKGDQLLPELPLGDIAASASFGAFSQGHVCIGESSTAPPPPPPHPFFAMSAGTLPASTLSPADLQEQGHAGEQIPPTTIEPPTDTHATSSPSAWIPWSAISVNVMYAEFDVDPPSHSDPGTEPQPWRIYRTIESQRKTALSLTPHRRLVWTLVRPPPSTTQHALTRVDTAVPSFSDDKLEPHPYGAVIARLTTEQAGAKPPPVARRHFRATTADANPEVGNLHWFASLPPDAEALGTMMLMLLWHRNRQVVNQERLGPTVEVRDPRYTGKTSATTSVPGNWVGRP